MNGIRAVQAFRRAPRNNSIMDRLNGTLADANAETLSLIARFTSTVRLVGNMSVAVVLLLGGLRVLDGTLAACSRRSCSTCAGSTTRSTS